STLPLTGTTRCSVFTPRNTFSAPGFSAAFLTSGSFPRSTAATPSKFGSSALRRSLRYSSSPPRLRSLQQDGGRELGPVEVPVQRLPVAAGLHVDPRHGVLHRI